MESRQMVWVGMFVGSTIGGAIPNFWGASFLSFSSIFFSGLSALLGIYIGFKLSQ